MARHRMKMLVMILVLALCGCSRSTPDKQVGTDEFAVTKYGKTILMSGHPWRVVIPGVSSADQGGGFMADDPFTSLVEADRWYTENVEAKGVDHAR